MNLDTTDLALVHRLQEDGRTSYETLAAQVGLSRAAARARALRLIEDGAVRIVGVIHPAVQGRTVSAHVAIAVDGPAAPVARTVAELSEAVFVTLTAGQRPVIAELRTTDFDALSGLVADIGRLPGVRGVDTTPYTRVLKDPYLPVTSPGAVTLDETDHAILRELQSDGRMSYAELADRIAMSAAAARSRSLRLLEAGVFRVAALVRPGTLGMGHLAGFAMRRSGGERGAAGVRGLLATDQVQFAAECVGRTDVIGTVGGETLADVLGSLEKLRALKGVHGLESWLHLELVKERYDSLTG
ncbi:MULTISPECIES: Lrp/AsnC family transcriptional regulator [unclassified Streptomyces]|uniref:Lrp/AsnC family transcriptional regulator n=1 Tax=unclassified Streptomyces TaxID=2593676 RepID=UPI002DD80FF7|nr:Lrp/AsnC family transcriptional regulator [Streptomyces sp. NBC_01766]WSC22452.1 Lrp/AsnC family transcriptional regulator [Streptomyces sp. NBC_01766]WSV56295.1 Lrp/AsnC family transcriptional regulator [Streptomyces sp. NBC_01014]